MTTPDSELDCRTLMGLAKIMRLAFHGDNLLHVTSLLCERIRINPYDSAALLDLSVVLQLNSQQELAIELQAEALQHQQHFSVRSTSGSKSIRLLAIMGPGEVMANTPIEFLVEDSDVSLELLYLGMGIPTPLQIPEHDVALVAVCESDQNQHLLRQLDDIMKAWPRPFINAPSRIARLSRDDVGQELASGSGFIASNASRLSRDELNELALGDSVPSEIFPLIARPVNSHAGHGLAKLDTPAAVASYLKTQSVEEFFVAPFIDYRSQDGWYRKYRVVVIDGQPFAAHMAISQNWMVHYLNADMLQNLKNREEEARFMQSFEWHFAEKHRIALNEIDRRMGLDYYSIDCSETVDGRLLVFELDSGAVVHSMDSEEVFPYKAPQMKAVFSAFERMLERRINQSKGKLAA